MNLIKPSFEIWEQRTDIRIASAKHVADQILMHGIFAQIERAGRICYKSEDKITYDSCFPFVERMIKAQHYAMLEHGTVYLIIPYYTDKRAYPDDYLPHCIGDYKNNPYSKVNTIWIDDNNAFDCVTTNYRVIIENKWESDMQYLCPPTDSHEKRVTVHFLSDIHFYKDITRHRVMSFAIESTRFCNYIKEKFGGSVGYATPIWLKEDEQEEFENDLKTVENLYFKWIQKGWSPQQAAYFLIQGTKADIIMTGFVSDYKHFFDLRAIGTTGAPHPTVKELAEPLMYKFKELNLL